MKLARRDRADLLAFQLRAAGAATFVREYRFHPVRRWRFDIAWPDARVACEVHGGRWVAGRHVRPQGFAADCEKLSAAAINGWRVVVVTAEDVTAGRALRWCLEALNHDAPP